MTQASPAGQKYFLTGVAYVLIAALGFSSKAILIKAAYAYGVDATTLLALRMIFSLPFFLVIAYLHARDTIRELRTTDRFALIGLGLMGYYAASFLDFAGLQYISANLERMILFLYPTVVVILSAVLYRRPITRHDTMALAICYLGITLIVFNETVIAREHLYLGSGLIFASAVAYAVFLVWGSRLMARTGSVTFTVYTMITATAAILIHFAASHGSADLMLPAHVYVLALAMAIGSTVVPAFLMSEGIKRIGAATGSMISSAGPVATLALAYIFLGETITPMQGIGALLVMAGILIVSMKK